MFNRKSKKRIISLLAVMMMIFTMVPGMTFADTAVDYDQISKYNVLTKNGDEVFADADGLVKYVRYGQYNTAKTISQYFFHGGKAETEGSAPSADGIYCNNTGHVFNYDVMTTYENGVWNNTVSPAGDGEFDSEKDIVFAVFYAGSQMNHLYKGISENLQNNILDYVKLENITENDTVIDFETAETSITETATSKVWTANNNIKVEAKFYDGKNGVVNEGAAGSAVEATLYTASGNKASGTGRERSTDVIITIPAAVLHANCDYKLSFEKTMYNGSQVLDKIVYNFSTDPIYVETVSLDKTNVEMTEGEKTALNVTVAPDEATDKTVTWTSSDETVASVDENGMITALKEGAATITVTTVNGLTATCDITVKAKMVESNPPADENDSVTPEEEKPTVDESATDDSDKDPAAQTGDESNMMPFFLLMMVAVAVAGTAVYRRQ